MSMPCGSNEEHNLSEISISDDQPDSADKDDPETPVEKTENTEITIVESKQADQSDINVISVHEVPEVTCEVIIPAGPITSHSATNGKKIQNGYLNSAYVPEKVPVKRPPSIEIEHLATTPVILGKSKKLNQKPGSHRYSSARYYWRSMKDFALAMRPALPYIIWLLFVVTGSCVFYLIEANVALVRDSRIDDEAECIGKTGFWGAVFYALSCCTTLGYGQVYPCTVATKVITVIYILIGIPLTLVVLAKAGKWVCNQISRLYCRYLWFKKSAMEKLKRNRSHRRRAASKVEENIIVSTTGVQIKVDDEKVRKIEEGQDETDEEGDEESTDDDDDLPDIPVAIGLLASLIFVLIGSIYYWVAEGYQRYESFYYSFVMFLTGDLVVTKFQYCIPIFICLLLGFGMVSTTVSIIINNINNLVSRTKRQVKREMKQRKRKIARGELLDPLDTEQEILTKILRKHGSMYLVALVSDEENKGMLGVVKEELRQVNNLKSNSRGCQTIYRLPETIQTEDGWSQDNPPTSENAGVETENPEHSNMLVQAIPTVRDHQAQVRSVPRTASKGINNTVQTTTKSIQAYPDMQDLSTQYPKMSRLRPMDAASEEKREPVRQDKPVKLSTR